MSQQPLAPLAQARSQIASLADHAPTLEATAAYERVLLRLDGTAGREAIGEVQPIDPRTWPHELDTAEVHDELTRSLEGLDRIGIPPLSIALLIALLDDARDLAGQR